MKGIVTAIQRFSLKDGPGIRTSVFLKGCNMRCRWCHNPETLSSRLQLMCQPERCIGCSACVRVCPTGALALTTQGVRYDADKCVQCLRCAEECFTDALRIDGRELTVEQVMAEVLPDKPYYAASGGGITLTGGEVTMQPRFALALLQACRAMGIQTAMETNLSAPWPVLEELLPSLDLVMYDVKLMNAALHLQMTGLENRTVLENARRLCEAGMPAILRTPVIPNVNDNVDELAAIGRLAASLHNVLYYELLRFNPLGESKYRALRMDDAFADTRPTPMERMEQLRAAAAQAGAEVRIG